MVDPLSEFEAEGLVLRRQVHPSIGLSRRERVARASRQRRPRQHKPRRTIIVIRFKPLAVPWRQIALGVTTMALLAVPSALVMPTAGARLPASDRPTVLGAAQTAGSIVEAAASLTSTPFMAALAASSADVPSVAADVEPVAAQPGLDSPHRSMVFDVREPAPQVVMAPIGAEIEMPAAEVLEVEAPPRRIGPPMISLTAFGGSKTTGSVALVLDVTEKGHVARVVVDQTVDLPPSFVYALSAAARTWRYEPARSAGIPVPAQVRVTVELHDGD